jgi:hypothetical protein
MSNARARPFPLLSFLGGARGVVLIMAPSGNVFCYINFIGVKWEKEALVPRARESESANDVLDRDTATVLDSEKRTTGQNTYLLSTHLGL